MLEGLKKIFFGNRSEGVSRSQTNNYAQLPTNHAKSPRSQSKRTSMSEKRAVKHKPYGNSIKDLYNDGPNASNLNPLNTIAIDDSENEDDGQATVAPSTANSARGKAPNPLRQGIVKRRRSQSSTSSESRKERRLLGGLTRSEKSENATIIPDPMKTNSRNKPFSGSLRPINNLDLQPSTRTDWQSQVTNRSAFEKQKTSSKAVSPQPEARVSDHPAPNKRPRTGPSPLLRREARPSPRTNESQDQAVIRGGIEDNTSPPLRSNLKIGGHTPRFTEQPKHIHGQGKIKHVSKDQQEPRSAQDPRVMQSSHVQNRPQVKQYDIFRVQSQQTPSRASRVRSPKQQACDPESRGQELHDLLPMSSPTVSPANTLPKLQSDYFGKPAVNKTSSTSDLRTNGLLKPRAKRNYESDSPDALQSVIEVESFETKQKRQNPLEASIVGNPNSTKLRRKLNPVLNQKQDIHTFELTDLRHSNLLNAGFYVLEIHPSRSQFVINSRDSVFEEPVTTSQDISKINRLTWGDNSNKLLFNCSRTATLPDSFILEFTSHKYVSDCVLLLQKIGNNINVLQKKSDWLDRAMGKMDSDSRRTLLNLSNNSVAKPSICSKSPYFDPGVFKDKQMRPQDRLDKPQVTSDVVLPIHQEQTGHKHRRPSPDPRLHERSNKQPVLQHAESDEETKTSCSRLTRSRARDRSEPADDYTSVPKVKYSETGQLGPEWKKSLAYPKNGKKRETVEFADLARLDDDEFLNDNLVNFFQRYLQHQTDQTKPELLKKMHFFSSYFYDTLNKNVKGKKGVNYEAVSKWTKTVDIFNRDFVIVPVNESLHWFVVIIYNLSYFLKQRNKQHENEDNEDEPENDPEGLTSPVRQLEDVSNVQGGSRNSVDPQDQHANATQKSFAELSLHDKIEYASNEMSTATDKVKNSIDHRKGNRKKASRRSLPKYPIDKPAIITFDSLGSSRSAAITALRQYIVLEAKEKRQLDIDGSELRGMTAKGIPSQDNFSDCGLYMCMYLEQFMCDPYNFVSRQLQREESQFGWPKLIHSHELRSRLREMILEIHREQEGQKPKKPVPQIGKILIDIRENPLEVIQSVQPLQRKSRSIQEVKEAKKRFRQRDDIVAEEGNLLQGHQSSPELTPPLEEITALIDKASPVNEGNPITIDDETIQSQFHRSHRERDTPLRRQQQPSLRHTRRLSSPRLQQRSIPVTDRKTAREDRGIEKHRHRHHKRQDIQNDGSSDILQGIEDYANTALDDNQKRASTRHVTSGKPRSQPTKVRERSVKHVVEVPETQEGLMTVRDEAGDLFHIHEDYTADKRHRVQVIDDNDVLELCATDDEDGAEMLFKDV